MFIFFKYQVEIINFRNTVTVRIFTPHAEGWGSGFQIITAIINITNVNALGVSNPVELPVLIG